MNIFLIVAAYLVMGLLFALAMERYFDEGWEVSNAVIGFEIAIFTVGWPVVIFVLVVFFLFNKFFGIIGHMTKGLIRRDES